MYKLSINLRQKCCQHPTWFVPIRFRSNIKSIYLIICLNTILLFIFYHPHLFVISKFNVNEHIQYYNINDDEQLSSVCFIPNFNPWDQTIAKSIRLKPLYRCPTNKQNLINIFNNNQLIINQTVNQTFFSGLISDCFFYKIDRDINEKQFRDWTYKLSEPILIENGVTEPIAGADFVLTRCYNRKNCNDNCSLIHASDKQNTINISINASKHLVYEYVHPIIALNKGKFSKNVWLKRKPLHNYLPPSLIILMLDAVSNLQAQRALPRTLSYLKSQGLFIFQQHSIVGDGTFENIVPILFGNNATDLQVLNVNDSRYEFETTEVKIDPKTKRRSRIKKKIYYPGPFDDYPFIVKNFSKLNYTTFFSEEWRESAFYNLKNGFRQSPTDYYLRPYWLSLYDTISYNKFSGNSNPKPCYLDKLLHSLSLNWLEKLINVYNRNDDYYPIFGLMKMNEMSHDYLERLFWIDHDLEMFFRRLFQENLLDNTIFILCGDHGHRQHSIRLTRIGSFEVKLPFFSILLPKSFRNDFPKATENLRQNQKKLTSWWDIYETFSNILKMVEKPRILDPLNVGWRPTTLGLSLFHSMPERNCSMAGIPEKDCPCTRTKSIDIELPIVKELSKAAIDYINDVKLKDHKHLCMPLELNKIIRAEVEFFKTSRENMTLLYTILFEVTPSGGIFEGRVLHNPVNETMKVNENILRINLYGQSSTCIQDKYSLRSYCYCLSFHKRTKAISRHRYHRESKTF